MQDIRKFLLSSNKTPKYDVYANESTLCTDTLSSIEPDDSSDSSKRSKLEKNKSPSFTIEVDSLPILLNNCSFSSGDLPQQHASTSEDHSTKEHNGQKSLGDESSLLSSIHNGTSTSARLVTPSPVPSLSKSTLGGSKYSRGSTKGRTPTTASTPGSSRSFLRDFPPSSIVAMVEGRGQARREIGMAAIDLNRPLLTFVHFTDTHTYTRTLTELSVLNPLEILFSNTAEEERLMRVVKESLNNVAVTTMPRKYFNEARGLGVVKHLAVPQCRHLERQLATKYYCLAGVAALIRYVEQIQHITYSPHTLMVKISSSDTVLSIDHWSCKKLELVRNLSKGGWEQSLFGAIRYTCTPSGTRMLRAALLQPFADPKIIHTRLSALEFLTQNPDLFHSLKSILGRFPDLDWLLSMCVQKHKEDTEIRMEQRLNYVIGLKYTLGLLNALKMCLETANEPFFSNTKESITVEGVEELAEILRVFLHEDARLLRGSTAMKAQRCYAIKPNIDGMMDIARKVYSEIVDDITGQIECLGTTYGVPTRVGHNASRGFHIIIPLTKNAPKPKLSPCFIQVQMGRGCISCTTEEIFQLDQRSKEAQREILAMSNLIVLELISEIHERVGLLYGVAEAIAMLDMVVGLTHAASLGAWVRPKFSNQIKIKNGRHAILDLLSTNPIVPNNTSLNQENRIMIISGPNMSGKSTYLKQVALIQILAQIGSFVPAEIASVKMVDHLFTLLGCEDNPENNASTFQVQMNEVSEALQLASPRSLIILDELGQGTNIEEGMALGWVIVEAFLSSKAFVLFATHIFQITRLSELYPQVINYHMESSLSNDNKLELNHILREGINTTINYGLALAASTVLPKEIIQRAYEVSTEINESHKDDHIHSTITKQTDKTHAIYILAHRLLSFAASVPDRCLDPEDTTFSSPKANKTASSSMQFEDEDHLKTLLTDMMKEFQELQWGNSIDTDAEN